MSVNYRKLGEIVELIDERNKALESSEVLGISIDKEFMPSVANTIGTDLSNYKLLRMNTFACNPMHVGRDERLPVSLYKKDIPAIVSPAYFIFRVKNENKVLPDFLMLIFKRDDFDRNCWFRTDGSVRGGITWNDICEIELPVPDLKEQEKIVNTYKAITKRIQLKQKINENLEKTAILKFENMLDNESLEKKSIKIESICEVKGGKRLPLDSDLIENRNSHPYIRIRDLKENCFVVLNNEFLYVDDETQKEIARYITETNDLLISIVGTIGLTALVHKSLDKANLTENCVKLTKMKNLIPEYVLIYLRSKTGQYAISQATVGAVQAKLPLKNIQNLDLPFFEDSIMKGYNDFLRKTFTCISNNLEEIIQLQSFRQLVISCISGM